MRLFEQLRVGRLAGEEKQLLPAGKLRQDHGGPPAAPRVQIHKRVIQEKKSLS